MPTPPTVAVTPACPHCHRPPSSVSVVGADPPVPAGRHTFVNYHLLCRCDGCRLAYPAWRVRPVAADAPTPYPPPRAGPPPAT